MSKTIYRWFAVLPFLALLAAPAQAARTAPVYTPEPIQVPAGTGLGEVKKAVRKALLDKHWDVREIGAGHLQGKHIKSSKKGAYTAVVDIKFDAKTVRIGYKSSENLDYNKEDGSIHKTYNNWVKYLEKNIRANLNRGS